MAVGFDLAGRRALVTGASSGIGAEIARVLASHGCNLVLAARRESLLSELGGRLGVLHGVSVDLVTVDLAEEGGPRRLIDEVERLGDPIDVLVNNAGVGMFGDGLDHDQEDEQRMLRLNVLAVAELTKHFGAAMRRRSCGRILQVASTAGFLPCPGYAAYGASKAFVLHHAEALAEELEGANVAITVVCPGTTNTDFFEISGHARNALQRSTALEPQEVAQQAVAALKKGRRTLVTGWANKCAMAGLRLVPRRVQAVLARRALS